MNIKTRIALAIAGTALVCLGAWMAGFDFNERGWRAFMVYLVAVGAFILIFLESI